MPKGIILLGPSGSGKTTLGKLVAGRLGVAYLEKGYGNPVHRHVLQGRENQTAHGHGGKIGRICHGRFHEQLS